MLSKRRSALWAEHPLRHEMGRHLAGRPAPPIPWCPRAKQPVRVAPALHVHESSTLSPTFRAWSFFMRERIMTMALARMALRVVLPVLHISASSSNCCPRRCAGGRGEHFVNDHHNTFFVVIFGLNHGVSKERGAGLPPGAAPRHACAAGACAAACRPGHPHFVLQRASWAFYCDTMSEVGSRIVGWLGATSPQLCESNSKRIFCTSLGVQG